MALGHGVDKIPLNRIPQEWSPKWFADFIREVLAYADTRNAIAGSGITITGDSSVPATFSASADVLSLINQPYVLAVTSSFLPNERILTGQSGYITITDGGPGLPITVGIDPGGLPFNILQNLDAYSVLGNPTAPSAPMVPITATDNDTVMRRVADVVEFGQLTLPMAPDNLWTYAKIQQGTALSVLGVTGNATANLADIVAGTDAFVLRRAGTAVGFGQVATGGITDDAVTYAKIQDVSATSRVLGRITSGAGIVEELTGANLTTIIGAGVWQPLNSNLTAYAGGDTPSAFTLGIVDSVDAAAWRTAIGAGTSSVALANPAGAFQVDLTGAVGAAATGLRSDAVLILSQAIAPTWSGVHTHQAAIVIDTAGYFRGNAANGYRFNNAADTVTLFTIADNGRSVIRASSNVLTLNTSAARGSGANYLDFFDPTGEKGFFGYGGGDDTFYLANLMNAAILFYTNGANTLSLAADGRLYGSALHNNAGAVTGTTNQYIASGTYTPTLTNVGNTTALSATVAQWMRVGNVVTVSGSVTATYTLGIASSFRISLPIASALASVGQVAGTASTVGSNSASISADATNDEALFSTGAVGVGATATHYYTFTYVVV